MCGKNMLYITKLSWNKISDWKMSSNVKQLLS